MDTRSLFLLCSALLVVPAAASCAKGSTITGINGDTGGSTSSSTGSSTSSASSSGSAGGSASSSTSSGASSSSSSSSSSSAGCPSPCKVTAPQCGCGAGEACTVVNGAVGCDTAGPDSDGAACGSSASDLCQAGLLCVNASSSTGQCLKFCSSDSDCQAPGGLCILQLDDGMGGSISGVTICTPNCSLFNNTGCPSGSACELRQESAGQKRWLTLCGETGTKTQGQTCDQAIEGDCAAGYTCLDTGSGTKCLHYCNADTLSGCSGATSCVGLVDQSQNPIVLGGTSIGVCL